MISAFTACPIIELKAKDKSKIESILAYGDRLIVGLSTGNLQIYRVNETEDNHDPKEGTKSNSDSRSVHLLREVEKFSTRSIEQLALIKESNVLISMSNSYVSIHDLHSCTLLEHLIRTKGASNFAITSNIVKDSSTGIPEIISRLAVSVKRKLLLWSWHESELEQSVSEFTLAEPIRKLTWVAADKIICGLNSRFVLVDILTGDSQDIIGPGVSGTATVSSGRFSAVGSASMGYIGLGGYTSKPLVAKLKDGEILLTRDTSSVFIACDGKAAEKKHIQWHQVPEAIGYSYPYILALQPPANGTLEVRNPETLSLLQSICLPNARQLHFPPPTVSLAHAGKGFHVASERCIWRMGSTDYNHQVNELVQSENYDEAISLLNMLESALLCNKELRLREVKIQKAQSLFDKKRYQDALDIFMAQDVQASPESVIQLFPPIISGTPAISKKSGIGQISETNQQDSSSSRDNNDHKDQGCKQENTNDTNLVVAGKFGDIQPKLPSDITTASSGIRSTETDSIDATSLKVRPMETSMEGKDLQTAVLALIGFLVQARNRMKAFLDAETKKIKNPGFETSDSSTNYLNNSFLVFSGSEDIYDTERKLLETAKLIDTTLFRSYMLVRPQLAGSLFRIPNFCDPDVVNEKLFESGRYNDLVEFFYGKKLHRSALELLKRLSGSDIDDVTVSETLRAPHRTVGYLQNLGPDMIDLILEFAEWPLRADPDLGMEIFTTDTENAETLPRDKVLSFFESKDNKLTTRYLEYIINELNDTTQEFHNKLIATYLEELTKIGPGMRRKNEEWKQLMDRLVGFMKKSCQYSLGKAFSMIPKDDSDFYDAQAVVLSNMGQHKQALELYVFKIKDYNKAEEYCNQIYLAPDSKGNNKTTSIAPFKYSKSYEDNDTSLQSIYHTLLSLYLTPPPPNKPNLAPALLLLANHGPRLPAFSTLPLIPAPLPLASLESYFKGRLRVVNSRVNESRIISGLCKAEAIDVQFNLLLGSGESVKNHELLSSGPSGNGGRNRRAIVSEDHICRACHKRIGNSVIAILADNAVVHYGCLHKLTGVSGTNSAAMTGLSTKFAGKR
ncbi:Bgt-2586 [Blumeria graminis f. sp. tritici]|uniref:Bgt-2586 n=2 Tax=Blumeria graminis f. sp. tritici TaxID=62690 RepID=A0A381LIT2_BLUGR|nr:Vacuolar protein [Blumeria graminis f. sp. tritici 96224]VDB93019.1 Bgt-2586 [Blumeria graminis f. sp. tritici]